MKSIKNDPLFTKSMTFLGWSGFACVVFFIIGGVLLGGMLPPLFNSADPAAEFAQRLPRNSSPPDRPPQEAPKPPPPGGSRTRRRPAGTPTIGWSAAA